MSTMLRVRWLRILPAFVLLILMTFPGVIGVGWGENGHKVITRLAVDFTPEPLRLMLAPYVHELEEAAVDPDRRKSEPGIADESERHFIDIDALEPYPFKEVPHDLSEAEEKYGKIHLHNQGIVPWAVEESFNNLVTTWQTGDAEWVRWLGDLSHYVADSHQPLHTTANFDGQKTGNRGIHALFESVMFDGFWKDAYVQAPRQSASWWMLTFATLIGILYLINPNWFSEPFQMSEPEAVEEPTSAPDNANPIDTQSQVTDAQVHHASLGEKYFDQAELERFGVEIDLTQVAYRVDVDLEDVLVGCPEADCIPSIDAPRFESSNALWLYDEDLVIGVNFNGEAKAYPISILTRHEIVNDAFADTEWWPVIALYAILPQRLSHPQSKAKSRVLAFQGVCTNPTW